LDIGDNGVTQLKTQIPRNWKSLEIKGVGINKMNYTVR
jgi:hypothetical protein